MFDTNTPIIVELLRIGAITSLYSLSILGWGHLARHCFPMPDRDLPDSICTRVVLGCFCLYAVFVFLGSVGLLRPFNVTIGLGIGLALALVQLPATVHKLKEGFRQTSQWSFGQRLLFRVICVLAALQIAMGFTPLIFYDTQVYQLATSVQFLNAGGFVHTPWNVYSNSPMALQLTIGMSWVFDSTGNTFKLLMTLLGCLALMAAARIGRVLGVSASLIAVLFVVSYPQFWIYQTLGVVDVAIASFLLLGAIWWQGALRHHSWSASVLAGIAFGLVIASRYQGLVLVVWTILALVAAESFRNPAALPRHLWKTFAIVAVIATMAAPWMIRNYLHFGNPVFPALYGSLGGSEWSADQARRLEEDVMGPSLLRVSATDIVTSPVRSVLAGPGNGFLGPVLMLGSLFALLAGAGGIRTFAALGLGGLVIWALIHPTVNTPLLRFNAASIMLLLICTGAMLGSERFRDQKGIRVAGLLAFGSFIVACVSVQSFLPVWQSLTNSSMRINFWRANLPSWQVVAFANANLNPAHDKVLLIGETRSLWLKVPFVAPSAFNGPQVAEMFTEKSGPDGWRENLRRLGITHLLINSLEWQRLRETRAYFVLPEKEIDQFNRWLESLPALFNDEHGNVLLALRN